MTARRKALTYGWYGDDLTGATDTLATIARRGQRAILFLDVPTPAQLTAAGPLDAIGIAGAARTMSPTEMRAALPAAATFFREQGVRLLHYKCCSTFDSSPDVGNLATAITVFSTAVDSAAVPIVGGQPSLGRYCVFSNLYAAAGDQVFRIDRHPTMSRHPSTPMSEADLTRHFAALGLDGVAAIDWPSVNDAALSDSWREKSSAAPAVLIDALDGAQVRAIGNLLQQQAKTAPILVVGASSVAEAYFGDVIDLPRNRADRIDGPVLALVGSLSPVTHRQVAATTSYRFIEVLPNDLSDGAARRETIVADATASLARGDSVMLTTVPPEGDAPRTRSPNLAEASAALLDDIITRARVRRLAIAGGDTSTAAITSLGFSSLVYDGRAARGVAVCRGQHDDPARDGMLILLKGGQMGPLKLFDDFANTYPAAPVAAGTRT